MPFRWRFHKQHYEKSQKTQSGWFSRFGNFSTGFSGRFRFTGNQTTGLTRLDLPEKPRKPSSVLMNEISQMSKLTPAFAKSPAS